MNDLNTRLEEIRRRSEILKQKQRQRQKWALAVVPLVLCLVLCIWLVPGSTPAAKDGHNAENLPERGQPMEPGNPEQSASTTLSVVRIDITGNGLDRMVSEPGVIRDICKILVPAKSSSANIEYAAPVGGTGKDSAGVHDGISDVIPSETVSKKEPYTIIFTDAEGAVQSFQLQGNALTDLSTEKNRELTANDLNTLYRLLGLPIE